MSIISSFAAFELPVVMLSGGRASAGCAGNSRPSWRERFRTGRRGDWGFRGKQRFRRLARSADSFAVVAARVGLSLLTKQDLLRSDRYAISKWELVNVHKLHLDGRGPIRKCVLAEMRVPENPARLGCVFRSTWQYLYNTAPMLTRAKISEMPKFKGPGKS